jgi:hypothetical protein
VLDLVAGQAKEVKLQEENGIVKMKSRGLGDSIHKFTTKTGIKTIVDKVSEGLNIPCGCEARRQALNKVVPYKIKTNK